jgi:hypothetical protein
VARVEVASAASAAVAVLGAVGFAAVAVLGAVGFAAVAGSKKKRTAELRLTNDEAKLLHLGLGNPARIAPGGFFQIC